MVYAFDNDLHTNVMRSKDRSSKQLITAKQKACIRWIISKAYSDAVATALREPYYRDNDNKERLKPRIVHSLANTEIYCLALSNIYSDPYYSCLNHQEVLQLLTRKGISVVPPADASLTETVLVQTAPLRMSAHMAIIEAIMALFVKEVLIPEKVVEVVNRFLPLTAQDTLPSTPEEAAVFWIRKCCVKMKHRIESELYKFNEKDEKRAPNLQIIKDLSDLNDGCALAATISFYCPEELKWADICLNESISAADRMYNIGLVQYFCEEKLEHNICFLTADDILHLHETIRPNILAFIADLLYLFEIRPSSCVSKPAISDLTYSDEEKPYKRTPDLPSPAEMKSRSLKHSDWVYNDYRNSRPEKKYRSPLLRQRSYDRSDEEDMFKHYRSMEFGIQSDHFPDVSFGKPYKTLSVSNLSKPLKNYKLHDSQRSRRFSKSKSPSRSERSDTSSDLFSLEREKNSPTLITNFVKLAKSKDNVFQIPHLHDNQATSPTINIAFKQKDTINPLLASQKTLRQLNDSSSIKECLSHKTNVTEFETEPKKCDVVNDDVHDLIRDLRMKLGSKRSNLDDGSKVENEAWNQQTLPVSEKNSKDVKDINSNFKESRKMNGSGRPVFEDNVDVSDLKHDLEQIIRRLEVHEKTSARRATSTAKQNTEASVDVLSAVDTLPLQTHPKATPYNAQHERIEQNSAEITPVVTDQMRFENSAHISQNSAPVVSPNEPQMMNAPKRGKWGLPAVPIASNDFEYQWIVAPVPPQYEHPYYQRHVANTYDMYSMHMYSHPPPPPPQPRNMYASPDAYYRSPPIPPPNLNRAHLIYPSQPTEMFQMPNSRSYQMPFPPPPQSMNYQHNIESGSGRWVESHPSLAGHPTVNNNESHNQTNNARRREETSQNNQDHHQQFVNPISRSNSEASSNDSVHKNGSSSDSLSIKDDQVNQKGFFIHFENDKPPKQTPKPATRTKSRHKQKHHSTGTSYTDNQNSLTVQIPSDSYRNEMKQSPVAPGVGFVIGEDSLNLNPSLELELARKKENVIIQSLRRKQEQEEKRLEKQLELRRNKEEERLRKEEVERKKEEDKMRRQTILEQYRQKKSQDESDSGINSLPKESSRGSTLVSQRHGKGRRHSNNSKQGSKNRDFLSLDRKSSRSSNDMTSSRNFGSSLSLNGDVKKSSLSDKSCMPRKLPSVSHLPSVPSNTLFESPGSDGICDIESTSSSDI